MQVEYLANRIIAKALSGCYIVYISSPTGIIQVFLIPGSHTGLGTYKAELLPKASARWATELPRLQMQIHPHPQDGQVPDYTLPFLKYLGALLHAFWAKPCLQR